MLSMPFALKLFSIIFLGVEKEEMKVECRSMISIKATWRIHSRKKSV